MTIPARTGIKKKADHAMPRKASHHLPTVS